MKDSIYQSKINEVYDNTNKNIFINASAGSGKSHTLRQLCKRTPPNKRICFLAFNKSIKDEAEMKFPPKVDISTSHSKGYKILRENVNMNVTLNENKNFIYCKNTLKDKKFPNQRKRNAYFFIISDIINFVKLNLAPHTTEGINKVCQKFGIPVSPEQIKDTIKVLKEIESWEKNLNGKKPKFINYTDMLYLAVTKVNPENFPKYDVVCLDEVQDFNILQQKLTLNLLKPNGRLVAVGDEKQNIYGFIGASLDTFNFFKNRPNTESLTLPITYRCGKKIVDLANTIFPEGTIPFEENKDGEIRKGEVTEAIDGDLIVCRNNKPLIKAWIKLAAQKQKAYIIGKDFGFALKGILFGLKHITDIQVVLSDKITELTDLGITNPTSNKSYQALKEKCEIIELLYEEIGDLREVTKVIDSIFQKDEIGKGVRMSTIHKAKGLESERCFILNWGLLPSEYATTESELYGERCLQYVAITRAKSELVFTEIDV